MLLLLLLLRRRRRQAGAAVSACCCYLTKPNQPTNLLTTTFYFLLLLHPAKFVLVLASPLFCSLFSLFLSHSLLTVSLCQARQPTNQTAGSFSCFAHLIHLAEPLFTSFPLQSPFYYYYYLLSRLTTLAFPPGDSLNQSTTSTYLHVAVPRSEEEFFLIFSPPGMFSSFSLPISPISCPIVPPFYFSISALLPATTRPPAFSLGSDPPGTFPSSHTSRLISAFCLAAILRPFLPCTS